MPSRVVSPQGVGAAPRERIVHLKSYGSAEYAKGQRVRVEFGNVPARDALGRYCHFAGFAIRHKHQYDCVTDGSGTEDGRYLLRTLQSWRLRDVFGHEYVDLADAAQIRDCMVMDHGGLLTDDPADIDRAVTATNATSECLTVFRFAPSGYDAADDGIIAHPLLDHRINANAVLEFNVAATYEGTTTEITWDGVTAMDAFAIVRYEDDPVVDANLYWRDFNDTGTDVVLPYPDSLYRWAIIRDRFFTASTGEDMSSTYYSAVSASAGGDVVAQAESSFIAAMRLKLGLAFDPKFDLGTEAFDMDTPEVIPVVAANPRAHRTDYCTGPVSVRFTRATKTISNYLVSGMFPHDNEKRAFIARQFGVNPGTMDRLPRTVSGVMPRGAQLNILPQRIYPPGRVRRRRPAA